MTRAPATAPGPATPLEAAAGAAVLTENLGKTYPGGTVAVAGLSLAVRRGEVREGPVPGCLRISSA